MPRERRSKFGNDAVDNAGLASQLAQKANEVNITQFGAKTGSENVTVTTQAFKDSIAYLEANGGGFLRVPKGKWYVNDTIIINGANYSDGFDKGGISIVGETERATKVYMTANKSLFQLGNTDSKMMIQFRNIELIGNGKTSTSVCIESKTVGGAYNWQNVYIHDFGTGMNFYDCTLASYYNVNIRNCDYGIKFGWQSDIHTFVGCRIDYCNTGLLFAWDRDGNKSSYLEENCITFLGCRISNNTLGWNIHDRSAGAIKFQGCYFEGNGKEGIIGTSANENMIGVKPLTLENCFYDPYVTPTEAISIYCECTVIVRNCMTVSASEFSTFIKFYNGGYERNSELLWEGNNIKTTAQDIIFHDRNYIIGNDKLHLGARQINQIQGDASRLGSNIWQENQMTAGTGKTWESWSKHASNNNNVLSRLAIKDVNGILQLTGDTTYPAYIAPTQFPDVTSLPNPFADLRGMLAFVKKADGDIPVICVLQTDGTHKWKNILDGTIIK